MSGAYTTDTDTPSLLYTLLPPLLQRRVPKIRSLRRTAGGYARPTARPRTASDSRSSGSITPPPSYRTTAAPEYGASEPSPSLPPTRPSSSGSATPPYQADIDSGVRWKYASHGLSLLSLSAQEDTRLRRSPRFERQLYVDSLVYLLRGLPAALSSEEEVVLKAAIPEDFVPSSSSPAETRLALCERTPTEEYSPRARTAGAPSLLHRAVATLTLNCILLLSFLLPHLQLLLQQAYAYERRHQLSDRVLAQGCIAAEAVANRTVWLANSVCAMDDGRVGRAMQEVALWWLHGVSGGVYEGLGEGMEVLGLRSGVGGGSRKLNDQLTVP